MKITSIESFVQGTNPGIVRVRTEDGAEGCGQLSPYDADITAAILHRKIAPFALGVDPADIGAVADRCMEKNYKFPWSFVCRALTGLDTVVWDWLGRHERKSVCELLGGNPVHPT